MLLYSRICLCHLLNVRCCVLFLWIRENVKRDKEYKKHKEVINWYKCKKSQKRKTSRRNKHDNNEHPKRTRIDYMKTNHHHGNNIFPKKQNYNNSLYVYDFLTNTVLPHIDFSIAILIVPTIRHICSTCCMTFLRTGVFRGRRTVVGQTIFRLFWNLIFLNIIGFLLIWKRFWWVTHVIFSWTHSIC